MSWMGTFLHLMIKKEEEYFQRYVSKYYMIGSFLVVTLAFIGIMNFFNTTATCVISRKKELALLEIVFGAKQILVNTLGTAFFFRLYLTIVPCVLMIPILIGIAYVIPKYQFEKMSRESSGVFFYVWKNI